MLTEFQEIVIHDGLTNLLHEVDQEVQVVVACQANAEGLICLEEVGEGKLGYSSYKCSNHIRDLAV